MAIAAVPAYLGKDFSLASPGLRFGMLLPLWGEDSRSGALLWTTSDVKYEARGTQREVRALPEQNKTAALGHASKLNPSDLATMAALGQRQSALAAPLAAQGQLLTLHAIAVAPFSTGLGNEHPLENGFAFLNPYGLPYLAGSGVKGVLRQSARELAEHRWGDDQGWTDGAITALFGKAADDGDTELQRGALMFWDVLPQLAGDALQVEVMTPHQSHYYQYGDSPHESGQPNPINFLTVPPGSKFVFHVQCDLPFLRRLAPDLARDGRWQQLLSAALTHAFDWLGFGAKTAVGYGAMGKDPTIAAKRKLAAAATKVRSDAQLAAKQRLHELEAMSPHQRAMHEFLDTRADKNQSELSALSSALKRGQWSGELKIAVAAHVKSAMQQAQKWKEKTEKKNPLKDHDHQDTLQVMKWLAGP